MEKGKYIRENRQYVIEYNMRSIFRGSLIGQFICLVFGSLLVLNVVKTQQFSFYIVGFIIFGSFAVTSGIIIKKSKFDDKNVNILCYLFNAMMLIYGIYMTMTNTKYPSGMFLILMICSSLLFIVEITPSAIMTICMYLVYLIVSYEYKDFNVFMIDLLNGFVATIVGIFLGHRLHAARTNDAMIRDKLNKLTGLDELTHLNNRRDFNKKIDSYFNNPRHREKTVAFLMIDIDDFKCYNDHFGHLKGDTCLIKIANIIKISCENTNFFCSRFGGEEFVIIGLDKTKEELVELTKLIFKRVDAAAIVNPTNSSYPWVTISAGGVVRKMSEYESYQEMINIADGTLYSIKKEKKNDYKIVD